MKGLLRSLVSTVVELEPEAPAEQKPSAQAAPQATAPVQSAPTAIYIPPTLNQELVTMLEAVSIKRATAYTTFLATTKKLESVAGMDDNMRLKVAFLTVTGEGRTLDQILQAIDVHVSDVDGEIARFNASSEANQRSQVDLVNQQAQQKLKENDDIARQIASLQEQIATATNRAQANTDAANELTLQAQTAQAQIIQVKDDFGKAAEYVKQTLKDRKTMLQNSTALAK